ncbi:uncharacterized protein LOC112456975 [Temnothorax curvispinosus]|uniref:Uncharacterized protein LOC112456975 n=1 Tax=Temnothorax curvispinosus TaxID=300111 RepID=A0A6J1Q0B7_9HYME|nr:uncharacterized protein LOC112456975 [Temnothorax curvispinosus]
MPLKFITSQRGALMLLHNGYLYNKKSVNKLNITWRCAEYRKRLCSAVIHTTSDKRSGEIVGDSPAHNHAADVAQVEARKVKEKLKKKASKGCQNNSVMIAKVLSKVLSPVRVQLPPITSLTRTVQRARKNDEAVIVNPKTLQELVIPNMYRMTNDDELFLLHDSEGGADRVVIYATAKNLELLAECEMWCCDGTFNSVPLIFKQLYTIHGLYRDKLLPLVYILAPNKSEKLYSSALSVIKRHQPNLKPKRVMVDYERAFIVAFRSKFTDCAISGCLFHFSQCIWRHVQSCGLQYNYNSDLRFCLNIKMLMALAFVPVHDVLEAYDELIVSPFFEENEDALNELIRYFERTWVGERRRTGNKRKKPMFDLGMWNCHQAVIDGFMRSNNGVEGWHCSFNNKVRVVHAIFSSFMDAIKGEQVLTETTIVQMNTGVNVVAKKRKRSDSQLSLTKRGDLCWGADEECGDPFPPTKRGDLCWGADEECGDPVLSLPKAWRLRSWFPEKDNNFDNSRK